MEQSSLHDARKNRLLASLPADALASIWPSLQPVSLSLKQVLYEPDTPIPYVYFPLNAVGSLLITIDDGPVIEFATVGNEGFIGLPVFLGGDTTPGTGIVQIPGDALSIPSSLFRSIVHDIEPLRDIAQRYTQAIFVFVAQSLACNQVHNIGQRCARWLLMTQDRVNAPQFPLTQDFLAQMLGVRRASVSEVSSQLQHEGLIQYSRGSITIVDHAGLESRACSCYRIIRAEFERSIGAF